MAADPDPLIAQALGIDPERLEAFVDPSVDQAAWLWLAAGPDRQHGGNDGYDDQPERYYSWDNTVPNAKRPSVGDAVVLWDKRVLLGASVIEDIEIGEDSKLRYSCPACQGSGFAARKSLEPTYKCNCGALFDEPARISIPVTTYRSSHAVGWVDLYGVLTGGELRPMALSPRSQLSLRPLNWQRFIAGVRAKQPDVKLDPLVSRLAMAAGHVTTTVRARVGQGKFRAQLLEKYGAVCAFTGPAPFPAIEAAHLYRYALLGEHYDDGGLPLRRDIHRLFDLGFIMVEPETLTIRVAPELSTFSDYAALDGRPLRVKIGDRQRAWLAEHWNENRFDQPVAAG